MNTKSKVILGVSLCLVLGLCIWLLTVFVCQTPDIKTFSTANRTKEQINNTFEDALSYEEWLEESGAGYSKQMISEELKARGFDASVVDQVCETIKEEDFSGQANMALGWLKGTKYTIEQKKEILESLGFNKEDYKAIIKAEGLKSKK